MAFTVQTDTPTAGANAYIAEAFFREYHEDRGTDTTDYDQSAVEAAIIKATQYLDVRFEYVGRRIVSDQSTEWPRNSAWNSRGDLVTGIPLRVKQATAEYALRALTSSLLADPDRDGTGRAVKSTSETVGPISERIEYADFKGFELPAYPLADQLLISYGLVADTKSIGGLTSGDLVRS